MWTRRRWGFLWSTIIIVAGTSCSVRPLVLSRSRFLRVGSAFWMGVSLMEVLPVTFGTRISVTMHYYDDADDLFGTTKNRHEPGIERS